MKMNTTFTVVARCLVNSRGDNEDASWKEDVNLEFDNDTAEMFLSRFSPEGFKLNDFKLLFKTNENKKIEAITLFKEDNIYIIMNPNQVITEVMDGYDKLRFLYRVYDVISFDYEAVLDFQASRENIEDEFGEE